MIVFIAGMQRSGSTFCFNVVREILARSGSVHGAATDDLAAAQAAGQGADHLVVKAHSAGPALVREVLAGRVKSIISVRAIAEAIASCMEMWGMSLEDAIGNLRTWRKMYRAIGALSLIIPYETINRDPEGAARMIAAFLSYDGDLAGIAAQYGKSAVDTSVRDMQPDQAGVRDVGFSYYDERTFFHRRHVLSAGDRDVTELLSAADLARISDEFKDLGNLG